ncbi:hypothetical protein AgCh_009857 [Apium graveolens]
MVKEEVESKGLQNLCIESESNKSSGVKFDGSCVSLISGSVLGTQGSEEVCVPQNKVVNDKSSYGGNLGLTERAFSAAGAAFLSAIIVNPLDLAKEGILRLWRGTNAGLALAVPTVGIYLPCYDIFRNYLEEFTAKNAPIMTPYTPLLAGLGAQLARDVPFSAICWGTLEPTRRRLLSLVGEDSSAIGILGANFSAGFVAGSLAAAATCPLDVAKMRRQIEKDPTRALRMTTRQTLVEIWRDGGMRGLFTGVGPRVGRAGPSVGIGYSGKVKNRVGGTRRVRGCATVRRGGSGRLWIHEPTKRELEKMVDIVLKELFLRARSFRTKSLKITTTNKMRKKDVGVKIPFLEKDNYDHWKVKMHLYLISQDEAYVECIEKGPHVPIRADTGNEAFIPKPRAEWSDPEIEQVRKDKKAMNILFNGVDDDMFDNIINCKTAKDVWETI